MATLDPNSKYAEERENLLNGDVFSQIEETQKAELEKDDYWYNLSTDTQRFMADTNGNNKIEFEEYKTFLLSQTNPKPSINQYETIHVYSLDYTVLIAIVIICITAIFIAWRLKKS